MIKNWIMIVTLGLFIFFAQSCSTSSGTAIRKVEYQNAKISGGSGVDSGKNRDFTLRRGLQN